MNQKDKNPDYKRIYRFVCEKYDNTAHFAHGPFDEKYFTMRVYESAKEIIQKIDKKVKTQQLLVAAILHDIGKIKLKPSKLFGKKGILENFAEEWHRHATLGVSIAQDFLETLGHSREFIDEVCYLIEHHDLRGEKLKNKSIELQILQDADLLADIGFAGFVRPFLYAGKFNRSVLGSIKFVQKEDRTKEGDELNLEISKKIAEKEMKLQRELAQEIAKDLESDLL
jgi:HD superfamily phosphodiesterase